MDYGANCQPGKIATPRLFGDAVALEAVLNAFPDGALIMGNIHPARFAQASEADVERETATALDRYAKSVTRP